MGIFLVFFLQFKPADGSVCRVICPELASCTRVLFGVHVQVNSVWNSTYVPIFGSKMRIRGSNIFPGRIRSLWRMCTMEIFLFAILCYFSSQWRQNRVYTTETKVDLLFLFILTLSQCKFAPLIQYPAFVVRDHRDSRANLMPIYGDLYQIKL